MVVRILRLIQQHHAGHRPNQGSERLNHLRIPAFAEIRHTFDDLTHCVRAPILLRSHTGAGVPRRKKKPGVSSSPPAWQKHDGLACVPVLECYLAFLTNAL